MLDNLDKTTKKGTILTRKGYIINKNDFSEKEIWKIKKNLTVKPVVHRDFAHFAEEFPVFYENSNKLYLPRYWGLENLGPPKKIDICDGKSINLKCVYEPRPMQKPIIKRALSILQNPFDKFIVKSVINKKSVVKHKLYGGGTIISIQCGLGKCMGKDTPILMYDGKIKMVQDVKAGDKLMGDDSKHRNVLSICNGKEQLYKIIPKRGNPYIVNESHILSLKCSRKNCGRFGKKNDTFDIPLKDYLNLPKSYRGKGSPICGYKVPVEFPEKEIDLEPYALGYWLGDGTSAEAQITTQEEEVVEYFQEYIKQLGGYVHQGKDSAKCRHSLHYSFRKCEFKNYLKKYNLLKNKHIPYIYKCNSRENRLKLLAGLIDSDGYHYNNMYSITQKNEQLLDDIIYLCLSLGFYAHKKKIWKKCQNWTEKRPYYETSISGYGLEEIPVIVNRKKCQPRKQIKNPLNSLITVEKLEVGDYYGFQIDGNRRFLLGDFTVTHNTYCALYIMTKLAQKTLIVVHTSVLLTQWIERIEQFVPGARVGIIKGPKCDVEDKDIVIAMLQTLVSENRVFPRGFFDQFGLSIVDECFPYDTSIITENGYSLIGTLYEMWIKGKKIPKILSYNQLTKNFEYQPLIHAWRKERTELVEIKVSKQIMKCTPEHKVLTSRGYMKAKDLTEGDLLISYYDVNKNIDINYISHGYARVDYVKSCIHNGCDRQTKPYVYDIEVKDNHNFIVCGTKSGNPHQGIVVSNCHHLAAPTFSRALPIMATKYFLGLSATPTRNDKLEKVFYWHLGYIGNDLIEKRGGREVIVKFLNYTNIHFKEMRRYNGRTGRNDAFDIPKMVDLIISCKRRLKFIRFQLKAFAEQGRQILVLSSRKIHLKYMKEDFDNFSYTKNVDGEEVSITTGYYMGGMKKDELEKSSKCDIIYGTYNLVAEGTDIPTLNTLLMSCPRKEVEQVVGRILRADTGYTPIVVDIADNFSIFINQGTYRQRFYKRQEYHIDVFDINKENYKDIILKDIKETEGLKRRKRAKVEEIVFSGLAICSDSDDD